MVLSSHETNSFLQRRSQVPCDVFPCGFFGAEKITIHVVMNDVYRRIVQSDLPYPGIRPVNPGQEFHSATADKELQISSNSSHDEKSWT